MGMPPNRIEILMKIDGVEFSDCYARRNIVNCDGVTITLIDYEDLKRNKLATHRAQDAGDVQAMERGRRKKM